MTHKKNNCSCGNEKDARAKKCWECYSNSSPTPPNKKGEGHGYYPTYAQGCRCDECKKASREYRAKSGGYLTNEQRRSLPCEECGKEEKLPGLTVGKECYSQRLRRYNINSSGLLSYEEYVELSNTQDHLCAICKQPEKTVKRSGRVQGLSIDHSHETGRVRGLLCNYCNRAIGMFFDNPALLREAAKYLEKNQ